MYANPCKSQMRSSSRHTVRLDSTGLAICRCEWREKTKTHGLITGRTGDTFNQNWRPKRHCCHKPTKPSSEAKGPGPAQDTDEFHGPDPRAENFR